MTVKDGEPELVNSGNVVVEIQYKQLDEETRERHLRALVEALARNAARRDHEAVLNSHQRSDVEPSREKREDMCNFDPNSPGVYNIGILEPFIHSLPTDEEQYHSMIHVHNLTRLSDFLSDFASAVALREHVETLRQQVLSAGGVDKLALNQNMHVLKRWDDMAGREAAMTIFHYGETFKAIRSGLRNNPTLLANANHASLRSAARQFDKEFPNADIGRHAAGHRGEFSATLAEAKKHAVSSDGRRTFIFPHMEGDEFVATAKGQETRLKVGNANREKLAEITVLVFSSFPILDGKLPPIHIR